MAQYTNIEPIELTDDELQAVAGGYFQIGSNFGNNYVGGNATNSNNTTNSFNDSGNVGAITDSFNTY